MRTMLIFLVCLLQSFVVIAKEPLLIVGEDFPPFSYLEDGEYKGIDIDILKEVSKRLSVQVEFKFYPWARAMAKTRKGHVDGAFGVFRNKSREEFFYYADAPLSYETAVLVVPEDSTRNANMLEDIDGWRVAQIRDTSYSLQYDSYDKIERVWVNSNKQSLELLNLKRIDAAIFNELIFNYSQTVLSEMLDFKKLDLTISKEPQHVVFSKAKGEGHLVLAEQFSREIKKLREEGVIHKIVRSYSSLSLK